MTALQAAAANASTLRPREPLWQQEAHLLAHFLEHAIRLSGRTPNQETVTGVLRDAARVDELLDQVVHSLRPDEPLVRWHTYCWRALDPKARRLTTQTLRLGALMRPSPRQRRTR